GGEPRPTGVPDFAARIQAMTSGAVMGSRRALDSDEMLAALARLDPLSDFDAEKPFEPKWVAGQIANRSRHRRLPRRAWSDDEVKTLRELHAKYFPDPAASDNEREGATR